MGRVIKWGIIGAGVMAHHFAEDLDHCDNGVFHAVASRTPEKAVDLAAQHGGKAYAGIDKLLADPDIDIIYVATPNTTHAKLCLDILKAGKGVLCEKPFAMNAKEAAKVINYAKKHNLFCMEAMWSRFLPLMHQLRSQIETGNLGPIRSVRAELGFPVDYSENSRFSDPKLGGGALLDLGIYCVSLVHDLLGAPKNIHAQAVVTDRGVDEHCSALMTYPGAQAHIVASHACELDNRLVITGETGRLEISDLFIQAKSAKLVKFARYAPQVISTEEPGLKDKLKNSIIGRIARKLKNKFGRDKEIMLTADYPGHGYQFQAEAAGEAMLSGKTETRAMPWDETIAVMKTLDTMRDTWEATPNHASATIVPFELKIAAE